MAYCRWDRPDWRVQTGQNGGFRGTPTVAESMPITPPEEPF